MREIVFALNGLTCMLPCTEWRICQVNEENWKAEFNARAKASMRTYLRVKSWPEKVDSIARMNREKKDSAAGYARSTGEEEVFLAAIA